MTELDDTRFPDVRGIKDLSYERNCSSGYETLSGQTTECDVSADSSTITDNIIYNGSESDGERNREIGRAVLAKRRKPRQTRRTVQYRDEPEADVDSDTTLDSFHNGSKDRAVRKPLKKRSTKNLPQHTKAPLKVADCRLQRHFSDPGAGYKRPNMHVPVDASDGSEKGLDLFRKHERDESWAPRSPHSSSGRSHNLHTDDKVNGRHCLNKRIPAITVSFEDSSENYSTLEYPSDALSSDSISFAKVLSQTSNDESLKVDSAREDSMATLVNSSLSSSCTSLPSPTSSHDNVGRFSAFFTQDGEQLTPIRRGRPESIQSYEQLLERIDRKLKQTEKLRTTQENELLKADLKTIQEQLNAIKLTSTKINRFPSKSREGEVQSSEGDWDDSLKGIASNETTRTDDVPRDTADNPELEISLLSRDNLEHLQMRQTRDKDQVPERQHGAVVTTDIERISRRLENKPSSANERAVVCNGVSKSCNREGDMWDFRPGFSKEYVVSGLGAKYERRRSDPTGLSTKFLQPHKIESNCIVVDHSEAPLGKDVRFALIGRKHMDLYQQPTYNLLEKTHGFLTPSGSAYRMSCSSSVKTNQAEEGPSVWDDSLNFSLRSSGSADLKFQRTFVYPRESITNPNEILVQPRKRITRIRYVDNSRDIMEDLATVSKRKSGDEHGERENKRSKKHKSSFIKKVKAGFNFRGAWSKIRSHKPSRKSQKTSDKLERSYTTQWVKGSSGSDDNQHDEPSRWSLNDSSSMHGMDDSWHSTSTQGARSHHKSDSDEECDFDPLAHLASDRSQRRGSFLKRIKKWYLSRSRSAENLSATAQNMQHRFEILNISDSPKRRGTNGPLVNTVIKNRSRSEENLSISSYRRQSDIVCESDVPGIRSNRSGFGRSTSSQSLVDTRTVRFADDDINISPNSTVDSRCRLRNSPGQSQVMHQCPSQTANCVYLSRPQHPCSCYCCMEMTPPMHQVCYCNRHVPCYGQGCFWEYEGHCDDLHCNCGQLPRSRPRRSSRSKPLRTVPSERVVPPLEMTVTHEKKAETRKLTVTHTFV